jgi:hypothetical protein
MYVEDTSSQPTSASNSAGDECEGHISITDKVPLHGSVRTRDVWAQLSPKAMASAQLERAHGLSGGRAEPKLSERAQPWPGPWLLREDLPNLCIIPFQHA